jgi:F420H(2)-dependent quinone reductase
MAIAFLVGFPRPGRPTDGFRGHLLCAGGGERAQPGACVLTVGTDTARCASQRVPVPHHVTSHHGSEEPGTEADTLTGARADALTGRNSAVIRAVTAGMTQNVELSPTDWVRQQTEKILEEGTTEGVTIMDRPVVLVTLTGAKSGKQRYVPVMRVEHDGKYAMVASKGGAPEHPAWYHNVKANPTVTLQDGVDSGTFVASEVTGATREEWWERAVAAYPPYAEYQTKTDRAIPVFVLEPKN